MPKPKNQSKNKNGSVIDHLSKALKDITNVVSPESGEEEKKSKYVVVRDHRRVNEDEYEDPKDPRALGWVEHYNRITKRWPDGTKTEVVPYNNKIHRVYGEIK